MPQVEMEVKGLEKAQSLLNKLARRCKDLSKPLGKAGLLLLSSVQRNFMVGGRPAWAALSEATKRMRGAAAKPLRDKGILMNSLTTSVTRPKGIWTLKPLMLAVGTNVPHAGFQQFGTKHIPARPFLVLQSDEPTKILKLLSEGVMKG